MDSILVTVRKALGIEDDYTGFDTELVIAINSAIMSLNQLGIGQVAGLVVADDTQVWADLIGTDLDKEGVKSYICLKTRLIFDPPGNGFLVDAISRQINELEWRLTLQAEPPTS